MFCFQGKHKYDISEVKLLNSASEKYGSNAYLNKKINFLDTRLEISIITYFQLYYFECMKRLVFP